MTHAFAISVSVVLVLGGCARDRAVERTATDEHDARAAVAPPVAAPRPRPRPPEPDPTATYAVSIEGAPSMGAPGALVTIVEAYEYGCAFGAAARATIDQIQIAYGADVRFVYQPFIVHPVATEAALAACAADRQDRFAEVDALLWESAAGGRGLDRDAVEAIGRQTGLDVAKMTADMDGACREVLRRTQTALSALGVRRTPVFYVNGRVVSGAQPFEKFAALIDEELAKARQRVAEGSRPDRYYQDWVVARGLDRVTAPRPSPPR